MPTGLPDLDELLSGLQPDDLIIVGARPAMGKTTFALGIAAHAAIEARRRCCSSRLEMGHLELTQRLLCAEARVDSTRLRNGRLHDARLGPRSPTPSAGWPRRRIYIDDNPNVTVMEIRAKARRLKSQLGDLGLVVIDYLQLMTGRGRAENRQVEVSEISPWPQDPRPRARVPR